MKAWWRVGIKRSRLAMLGFVLGTCFVFSAGCARRAGKMVRFEGMARPVAGVPTDVASAPAQYGAFGRQIEGIEVVAGGEVRRARAAAGAPPAPEEAAPPAPPSPMVPGGGEKETQPSPIVDLTAKKRLVIYTAQFSILVANVEDSMKTLLEKIKQWDGYVQTSDLKRVTFRVPAEKFDRVVEEISQMGVVTNKQIQAEDVTRQYTDLQLRLEVAEASRKRLMALLEKAQKTEDLLKIENEIRRLTEEIERMKAELRTLADRIAYSTITVELSAKAAEVRRPRPQGSYFTWVNQIGAENVLRRF